MTQEELKKVLTERFEHLSNSVDCTSIKKVILDDFDNYVDCLKPDVKRFFVIDYLDCLKPDAPSYGEAAKFYDLLKRYKLNNDKEYERFKKKYEYN